MSYLFLYRIPTLDGVTGIFGDMSYADARQRVHAYLKAHGFRGIIDKDISHIRRIQLPYKDGAYV